MSEQLRGGGEWTALRELVANWRKQAKVCTGLNAEISAEAIAECADELEEALAAAPSEPPAQSDKRSQEWLDGYAFALGQASEEKRKAAREAREGLREAYGLAVRRCVDFLQRQADENCMPNEPTQVLIKGLAMAMLAALATPAPKCGERLNDLNDFTVCTEPINHSGDHVERRKGSTTTWYRTAPAPKPAPPAPSEDSLRPPQCGDSSDLAAQLTEARAALTAVEVLVSDDASFDWSMQKLRGDKKVMHQKLSTIYRITHSCNPTHSCYHVHGDWRKEAHAIAEPAIAEEEANRSVVEKATDLAVRRA